MAHVIDFLKGKKTYIIGALLAILVFLKSIGKVDQSTYDQLQTLLLGSGLATLRAALGSVK